MRKSYSYTIDPMKLVFLQQVSEEFKHFFFHFYLYLVLNTFKGINDDESIVWVRLLLLKQVVVNYDLENVLYS